MFTSHVHHIHIIFLDATWAKIIRYKSVSKKMMYNASPKWKKLHVGKDAFFGGPTNEFQRTSVVKVSIHGCGKTTLNVDHFPKKGFSTAILVKTPIKHGARECPRYSPFSSMIS